ncbi:MAG TPA: uroporphyrinogen-III C-methyltransferase [Ramlibacter sp.]|jgi:uroporphyrin-3 C-methyltransferase|uniref:uroporphyrinogen-III C-methyltransferase n=1 Tax=Ramlibacter sp. TaxID=1917967 RepID=UPI002D2F0DC0|nr:uroporphyrinogen-III C-methyltransferase [Ramlibacter sp.]HZY20299.1 uroporphyrinogen-III C-methyltransferase [Ramlibacter sp.]
MSAETVRDTESAPPVPALEPRPAPVVPAARSRSAQLVGWVLGTATVLALGSSVMLWQKLSTIQEQLARQSADAGSNAVEARTLARQAQDLARDVAARQAATDARISEVALQRTQLEDLMQSLSRSRDENLVVDIDASLRLAQQQAQLTMSAEPLLGALRAADQRLARAAEPRLARIRTAVTRDMERIRTAAVADVPGLLLRIDEMARQVDDLPLANAVGPGTTRAAPRPETAPARALPWWQQWLEGVRDEARALVRVSRVDQPEAALLAPEQGFFLRENLKLRLMNARLALLARQTDAARADVASAAVALNRYFDPAARRTQAMASAMQQVQTQLRVVELPRVDETLAALATVAGR